MAENPLISIITSTFNAEKTLERCLNSVENQTSLLIEHIIIDGNSTDSTKEIIKKHAVKPSSRITYWVSEKDDGIYNAWNKALFHVNGEWVCFLGGDDCYYSNTTIETAINFLKNVSPDISIAYGKIAFFDSNPNNIICYSGKSWGIMKKNIFTGACLPQPATFHRFKIFQTHGIFDTRYRIAADYDLLLRVLKNSDAQFLDLPLVSMQRGGISDRTETIVQVADETYRALKMNNAGSIQSYIKLCYYSRIRKILIKYFPKYLYLIRKYKLKMECFRVNSRK